MRRRWVGMFMAATVPAAFGLAFWWGLIDRTTPNIRPSGFIVMWPSLPIAILDVFAVGHSDSQGHKTMAFLAFAVASLVYGGIGYWLGRFVERKGPRPPA